jgi:hypothetical protein
MLFRFDNVTASSKKKDFLGGILGQPIRAASELYWPLAKTGINAHME